MLYKKLSRFVDFSFLNTTVTEKWSIQTKEQLSPGCDTSNPQLYTNKKNWFSLFHANLVTGMEKKQNKNKTKLNGSSQSGHECSLIM